MLSYHEDQEEVSEIHSLGKSWGVGQVGVVFMTGTIIPSIHPLLL